MSQRKAVAAGEAAGVTTSTTAPGAGMTADIGEQPEVFAHLAETRSSEIAAVATQIAQRRPKFVLYTARGTSDHAALYAAYLTEIRLGIPAALASPSTMTVYGARPDLSESLVVGVSQSGGSPDIAEVLRVARESGAATLAVTNNPESALAAQAHSHIDVSAGRERAVAATKTYTAELLALFMLIEGIGTGTGRLAEPEATLVASLPELARTVLEDDTPVRLAERYRFAERLVTTGRGYAYPTARETALKLMETSYLSALSFSGADLLHGPLAMTDPDVPVLAIVGDGPGGDAMRSVIGRLGERRADVVTIGPQDVPGAHLRIPSPRVDERIAPLVDILPLQRLALSVALTRGENPDAPRGLRKVTETL